MRAAVTTPAASRVQWLPVSMVQGCLLGRAGQVPWTQAMHNACWAAHLVLPRSIVSSIDRPLIEGAREHGLKPYRRRLRVGLTRIRDASKVWA